MRRTAILLAGLATLAACGEKPIATEASTQLQPSAAAATRGLSAEVQKELATLRSVTAPFHDIETAKAAGWSAKITDCMASPAGGMGFHYGNVSLIDATVRVEEPELLVYAPEKNGRMRLVAVEYIIPYTEHSRESTAPVLFGQKFSQNDTFQLWGLHAWVWDHNPSEPNGMFASWNPRVTCPAAAMSSTMSH
jgi:hypothetical protein